MKGYLLPHPPVLFEKIGKGRQYKAQATLDAYQQVENEIRDYAPDITILITPHGPLFEDGLAIYNTQPLKGNFQNFGAPKIGEMFVNDLQFVSNISREITKNLEIPVVLFQEKTALKYHMDASIDHGALVPLMLCNIKSKVVVINYGLISYLNLYKAGVEIGKLLQKYQRPLILASGDLSHKLKDGGPYNYDPAGPAFDNWLMDSFKEGELFRIASMDENMVKAAGECGMRSIEIMLGVFDGKQVNTKIYSYEGPFGVGYGIVGLVSKGKSMSMIPDLLKQKEDLYAVRIEKASAPVKLAFAVIEKAVKEGENAALQEKYNEITLGSSERRGVFVSIKCNRGLRGCIGTYQPVTNSVREEIIQNAVSAALHDPRFNPIKEQELNDLVVSVDFLDVPVKIHSLEELDPVKYGIIVSNNNQRGLLLPNLEGVESVEEQIRIAKSKAGIKKDDMVEIQKFEVIRYE